MLVDGFIEICLIDLCYLKNDYYLFVVIVYVINDNVIDYFYIGWVFIEDKL